VLGTKSHATVSLNTRTCMCTVPIGTYAHVCVPQTVGGARYKNSHAIVPLNTHMCMCTVPKGTVHMLMCVHLKQ